MECAKCGAPGEWTKLHDVITGEGIVKLCKRCILEENAPVIHRPTESEIQSVTKSESLYKRLSNAAGLNPTEHRKNVQEFQIKDLLKKEEVTLRDLVDKKFDRFVKQTTKKREDLIDNFHWVIMRARRSKKKSVTQLAREIGESERAIKMAEQGVLPEGYIIVRKLEDALGIRILKPEIAAELERQKKQLGFDKYSSENLTISDLQEMKKEEIHEHKNPYWRRFLSKLIGKRETQEEIFEEPKEEKEKVDFEERHEVPIEFDDTSLEVEEDLPENSKDDETGDDISQKDIDDILFGRK